MEFEQFTKAPNQGADVEQRVVGRECWFDEDSSARISTKALNLAQARGFSPGYAHEDWLAALDF